jgi:microsomal dipeptidase-like Zn-dependent dipeptidase
LYFPLPTIVFHARVDTVVSQGSPLNRMPGLNPKSLAMSSYIADLHCHSAFKPYNNLEINPQVTIWESIGENPQLFESVPNELKPIIAETARSSQSNLNELFKGKIRGLFMVIHPMERGWLYKRKNSPHPVRNALLKQVFKPEHYPPLAASLSGIPLIKINRLFADIHEDRSIDYYEEETYPEYEFIKNCLNTQGLQNAKMSIVRDYAAYRDVIDNHPDTIAVILTIEGGHALAAYPNNAIIHKEFHHLTPDETDLIRKSYLKSIKRIKSQLKTRAFQPGHTPFFLTLAHMYNNFLTGHAKSYREGAGIFPGMDDFLDQEAAMNDGITPLGYEVIEKLLAKSDTERRILIDVKHMSLTARKEYYKIIEGKRAQGDPIPVIFSHGSVNGFPEARFNGEDTNSDDQFGYLSHWSINLYNEDILKIYESDGIIGLAPHEGRMPGGEATGLFSEIKQAINWHDHREKEYRVLLRQEYIKLFLTNVFHIVAIIGHKKAWDIICIGSDYDGIMNPFDSYPKSSDLMLFMGDIKRFLDNSEEELTGYFGDSRIIVTKSERDALMFGLSSSKIIRKLGSENIEKFLEKYFTTGYLGGGNQLV